MTAFEKLVFLLAKDGKRSNKEQVNVTMNLIYAVLCLMIGSFGFMAFHDVGFGTAIKIIIPAILFAFATNWFMSIRLNEKVIKHRVIEELDSLQQPPK